MINTETDSRFVNTRNNIKMCEAELKKWGLDQYGYKLRMLNYYFGDQQQYQSEIEGVSTICDEDSICVEYCDEDSICEDYEKYIVLPVRYMMDDNPEELLEKFRHPVIHLLLFHENQEDPKSVAYSEIKEELLKGEKQLKNQRKEGGKQLKNQRKESIDEFELLEFLIDKSCRQKMSNSDSINENDVESLNQAISYLYSRYCNRVHGDEWLNLAKSIGCNENIEQTGHQELEQNKFTKYFRYQCPNECNPPIETCRGHVDYKHDDLDSKCDDCGEEISCDIININRSHTLFNIMKQPENDTESLHGNIKTGTSNEREDVFYPTGIEDINLRIQQKKHVPETILREYAIEKINWGKITQELSESFIREFQDKVSWECISWSQSLSEAFIREFQDKINWEHISWHQSLSEEFIREFQDQVCWVLISESQKLSESFIREFQDKLGWDWILRNQKLSESFIREFQDKLDWASIFRNQKLSESFIREFQDKLNWASISYDQKLSESFIRGFQDKLGWGNISQYQSLSESFIREFQDKLDWNIWRNYDFSSEFIEEFKNKFEIPDAIHLEYHFNPAGYQKEFKEYLLNPDASYESFL